MTDGGRDRAAPVPRRILGPTNPFAAFEKWEIEQSIPDRFGKIAAGNAGRVAVTSRGRPITYEELSRTVDRVAEAVTGRHNTREGPVALLLGNRAPVIAAILGVLKAGAFYVPLDPSYPRSRLARMLEHSRADLLVTDGANRDLAAELAGTAVPTLDLAEVDTLDLAEVDTLSASAGAGVAASAEDLVYLLYTSGSTGEPKGIFQTHRTVLHMIMNYVNTLHIAPDDRLALLESPCFGGSVLAVFGALLTGARLCLFDAARLGTEGLGAWLAAEGVTIYCSVPALFRRFASSLTDAVSFPDIRIVRVLGDTVRPQDVELYRRHFPDSALFVNGFGTNESTLNLQYFMDQETPLPDGAVPIGYPVDGVEPSLLDDAGQEVGPGRVGEIAIRSRHLAEGYWRDADLTRARFLPDPDGGKRRIYLTGDLGRRTEDGCYVHLGRKDFRVKVSGYQVAIDEVEALLAGHPGVREAVVVPRTEPDGDKRLVAYMVAAGRPAPSVTALRQFLAEGLPEHAVPSAYVWLPELPLTALNKLDRRSLPEPGTARPDLADPYVAPRTPVEEELAAIWADVLRVDRVGVHDSFLELGGSSLLAARVINRVRQELAVQVEMQSLMEAPTVEGQAMAVLRAQAARIGDDDLAQMLNEVEDAPSDDDQ